MTGTANTEAFDAWNGDSGKRWAREADRRDDVLASVADAVLDAAQLRSGEDVLDIGCGCGSTTLAGRARSRPAATYGGSTFGTDARYARQRRDRPA